MAEFDYEFVIPVQTSAELTQVEIDLIRRLLAESHAPIIVRPSEITCTLVRSLTGAESGEGPLVP